MRTTSIFFVVTLAALAVLAVGKKDAVKIVDPEPSKKVVVVDPQPAKKVVVSDPKKVAVDPVKVGKKGAPVVVVSGGKKGGGAYPAPAPTPTPVEPAPSPTPSGGGNRGTPGRSAGASGGGLQGGVRSSDQICAANPDRNRIAELVSIDNDPYETVAIAIGVVFQCTFPEVAERNIGNGVTRICSVTLYGLGVPYQLWGDIHEVTGFSLLWRLIVSVHFQMVMAFGFRLPFRENVLLLLLGSIFLTVTLTESMCTMVESAPGESQTWLYGAIEDAWL
ncbi:hypothetical protein BSKO_06059 [Bryopsis sp. KO-2023]|nr:hypothetical protein BSKO_06059 [Bryopsis sp. KO-2023]